MPNVFISYSRDNVIFAEQLADALKAAYGNDQVWYDQALHVGEVWWREILARIAWADVFIFLISARSMGSPFCTAEYQEAQRLQRPVLGVLVQRRFTVKGDLAARQYIDLSGGLRDVDSYMLLLNSINRFAAASKPPPLHDTPTPMPVTDIPTPMPVTDIPADAGKRRLQRALYVLLTIFIAPIVVGIIVNVVSQSFTPAPATPPPIVGLPTATPTDTPQALPPTLSSFEQLQTAQMQLTQSAATQAAADVRATEDTVLSANASATAQQIMATEAAAYATLLALSWTPMPMFTPPPTATLPLTPRPTATLTVAPTPDRASGLVAVTRNDAWTPIIRAFEGVDMALVPVGCFMMGSTEYPNEQPVHEVCFDAPFWIDVTEVTQFQFRAFGGVAANDSSFTGDQRPVESITWFEAYAYCVNQRGMRLPSEAEWEYAARGVESWVYPWGDSFSAENVVYNRSSSDGTADVGSRPAGASWVGALDLSGNVWEWVNTIYNQDRFPYPYDQSDGRETYSDNRTDARVLRGGSWDFTNTGGLRAPNRVRSSPDGGFYNSGFRCSAS